MGELKIILEQIVYTILIMGMLYLIGSFIAWDFNPTNWLLYTIAPGVSRLILLVVVILVFASTRNIDNPCI